MLARPDFPDCKPAAAASSAAAAAAHITHTDWLAVVYIFKSFYYFTSPMQEVTFPHPATQMFTSSLPLNTTGEGVMATTCTISWPTLSSAHLCIPGFSVTLTENRAAYFFLLFLTEKLLKSAKRKQTTKPQKSLSNSNFTFSRLAFLFIEP